MSLFEVNEAAAIIKETSHPDVNLIFGAVIDENMRDTIRITVIATGFERSSSVVVRPVAKPAARPSANQPTARQPVQPQPTQPAAIQQSIPVQQPPPMQPAPRQPVAPPPAAPPPARQQTSENPYDNDDLDIPTFLRKR